MACMYVYNYSALSTESTFGDKACLGHGPTLPCLTSTLKLLTDYIIIGCYSVRRMAGDRLRWLPAAMSPWYI